jgi:uncharacterized protein with HEPN domain
MAVESRDLTILKKIIGYCDEITDANNQFGNTLENLKASSVYRNAVSMCVLQIGELSTQLTDEFKETHLGILWKSIKGMRNIIAHHYGKFDVDILWNTIDGRIPELKEYCLRCIEDLIQRDK